MLNLISSGDMDTGKVKRYLCDTLADFAEIPHVAEGSTVLVQSTGEIYRIDKEGKWKYDGCMGNNSGGGSVNPDTVARLIEAYFETNTPVALNTRISSIENTLRIDTIPTLE